MADAVLYGIHLFLHNHISVDRQIGQNDGDRGRLVKKLVSCRLIESTWKTVDVSIHKICTNINNLCDQRGWDIKRADSCMQCMCTAGACILFFSPIGSWLILSAEPVYAFLLKPVFTFFVS